MKNAFVVAVVLIVLGGAYYSGYQVGSNHSRIEYVTKEVEKIRYVSREKSKIQAQPNATKKQLLDLMKNNML